MIKGYLIVKNHSGRTVYFRGSGTWVTDKNRAFVFKNYQFALNTANSVGGRILEK